MKKFAGDIILHMCAKNRNIWCTVPEIWSERHNFLLFWVIFIWCKVPEIWSATDIIFCHSGLFFCPFTTLPTLLPPMDLRNQNPEKMKKTPKDIIILQMCTINESHWCMVPEIWSATDRIFLSFCTIFCPFTHLRTRKIKIF